MFTAAVIWLRSVPTDCVGLAFIGLCYKQILYEIILYECYGHGKMCQDYFNFELPSGIIEKRRKTFVACCIPVS